VVETQKIIETIFDVLEVLNPQLPSEQRLEKSVDTLLFGKHGRLDSLGLVNLIVAIEEEIEEQFGILITLADEKAMSQKKSPFRTIESLADYIRILLEEN
jgi:acyl carrier protein